MMKPGAKPRTGAAVARVTHRFDFPPERVFDAWLDPAAIGRFLFGPSVRDEEVIRITIDARVGGAFSYLVRRQGREIDHYGRYLEIERPRRLAFTWAATPEPEGASRVAIDFVPLGGGCEVRLIHELAPQWSDFVARAEETWAAELAALDAALRSGPR